MDKGRGLANLGSLCGEAIFRTYYLGDRGIST